MMDDSVLKHWIPLTSLDKMAQTEYDVLVVGAGAGGPAALWRLCEQWGLNGKKIGMLERGDLLLPTHALNIPTMNATRKQEYYKGIGYPLGSFQPDFSGATEVFALGGRTLFWSAAVPRLHPADMQEWPISYDELIPYYNIAERAMNVTDAYTQDSTITRIMLEIVRKSGFPHATEMPFAIDLAGTKFGQIHSNTFFSSIAFLAMALNRRPFDLAVNARAVQILTKNGKATGVRVMSSDKKSYLIQAKTIVLSASTWETPRLLLYSGIQGRAIGHYLSNHSKIVAAVRLDRDDFPEVLGTLAIVVPRTAFTPYQLSIHGPNLERHMWYPVYEEIPLLKEFDIGFTVLGIVQPRYDNHISLNPHKLDEFGVPEIQVTFSYGAQDKTVIEQMFQATNCVISGIHASIGIKDRPEISLSAPGADYHEMGTCRMGNDSSTSATNRFCQLHGMPNLYIADNSVLPFSGAANPTLTTIALALRTADHIMQSQR